MGIEPGVLAGVVVYAKDVDAVAAFYASVVPLRVVERDEGFVVLSCDGASSIGDLSIVAMPVEVADSVTIEVPPVVRQETPVKPSFLVESLSDAARAASEAGGGAKPLEAAWDFRGLRHLDGFDPEGNVVQFVERLEA